MIEPEDDWGTYFRTPDIKPVRDYDFINTARRWETGGTANYPGAIGLAESVALINEVGIDNVGEHILALTDYLIDALQQQGISIVTPLDRRNRSGIVSFTVGTPEENFELIKFLQQRKVLVSLRYTSGVGGVRVACHLFNNREDLDRLAELSGEFVHNAIKATA